MKSLANDISNILKSIQPPQGAPERRPEPTRTNPGTSTPKGLTTRYTLNGEVCKVTLLLDGHKAVVRVGFKVSVYEGLVGLGDVVSMVMGFRGELEQHEVVDLFVTAPGMRRKLRRLQLPADLEESLGDALQDVLEEALPAAMGDELGAPPPKGALAVKCYTAHDGKLLDIEVNFLDVTSDDGIVEAASAHWANARAVRVAHVNPGHPASGVYAGMVVDCSKNRTVRLLVEAVRGIVKGVRRERA